MSFLSQNALPLLTLLGGALQTTAQIQQGRREADLHEYNASVQRQQASLIMQSAEFDIERQRKKARSFKAEQMAVIGASGVRASGSPLEVIEDTAAEFILDQQATRYNAQINQYYALTSANISLMKAQNARSASYIKAGQSLLNLIPTLSKLKFASPKIDTSNFKSRFDLQGQLEAEGAF